MGSPAVLGSTVLCNRYFLSQTEGGVTSGLIVLLSLSLLSSRSVLECMLHKFLISSVLHVHPIS